MCIVRDACWHGRLETWDPTYRHVPPTVLPQGGHHWLAVRIPEHAVFVSANQVAACARGDDRICHAPGLLYHA